jgi:hypothetical protein
VQLTPPTSLYPRCGPKLAIIIGPSTGRGHVNRAGIKSHFSAVNDASSSSGSSSSSNMDISADTCLSNQVEELEAVIKSTIWIFRSSVNNHKTWTAPPPRGLELRKPGVSPSEPGPVPGICHDDMKSMREGSTAPALDVELKERLMQKQKFAPYWGVLCPSVKKYCEDRRQELDSRLLKYYRSISNSSCP